MKLFLSILLYLTVKSFIYSVVCFGARLILLVAVGRDVSFCVLLLCIVHLVM